MDAKFRQTNGLRPDVESDGAWSGGRGVKNSKNQIQNPKIRGNATRILELGIWNFRFNGGIGIRTFFGCWNLGFGNSALMRGFDLLVTVPVKWREWCLVFG